MQAEIIGLDLTGNSEPPENGLEALAQVGKEEMGGTLYTAKPTLKTTCSQGPLDY